MSNTEKLISLYVTRPFAQTRLSRWKVGSWVPIILISLPLHAQVITDGTVGDAVTLSGENLTIAQDLGTLQGNNLFHSFQTFNIQSNGSATFTGANNINNVISRVTGGEVSNINGTLRSEVGQADFFFINPTGVVFGAGAQVDVPASFHVSTADEMRFRDNAVYSATNPETSTLTLAPPEAFGFLGQNQSSIALDQAPLQFQPGADVSIVSGDITIQDSFLFVDGGDIRIVAQGNNISAIPITGDVATIAAGDLLVGSSTIDGGNGGGNILLQAGEMLLTDEAGIRSTNNGGATTLGTDIEIIASDLTILNGALVFSDSQAAGRGGNIRVLTEQLMIDNQNSDFFTGITNQASGSGDGGNIEITSSGQLTIVNGGEISGSSFGDGDAGSLTVNAERLLIDRQNSDFVTALASQAQGAGAGGTMEVTANELTIVNGGQINASSVADGDAGSATVNAERLLIDRQDSEFFTGIASSAQGAGAGGTMEVTANELTIVKGGQINASSFADGDAGSATVNAERLLIDSQESGFFTGISSQAHAAGAGGTLEVTANELTIVNGGEISASSLNAFGDIGDSGSVTVNAERLLIDRQESGFFTGISSIAEEVDAGSVSVIAGDVVLLGGQITTSTAGASANGGPINVSSDVLVLNGSFIQANSNSGQGGNITIGTDAVVASSNAVTVGGVERLIFQNDGSNVIQAVAPDGVNGLVSINAPDIDVSGSLLALDPSFINITGLAFDPCAAFVSGAPSTFTLLGRGGLPSSPKSNTSLSLTGELLDQLLDGVNADSHLTTIDRVHLTKFSFTSNAMTGLPVVSSHGSAIACS